MLLINEWNGWFRECPMFLPEISPGDTRAPHWEVNCPGGEQSFPHPGAWARGLSASCLFLSPSGQTFFLQVLVGTILPREPSLAVLDLQAQPQLEALPLWSHHSKSAIVCVVTAPFPAPITSSLLSDRACVFHVYIANTVPTGRAQYTI